MKNLDNLWAIIVDEGIATEAELQLVTCINGYTEETLNDVIDVRTGYHTIEQYLDCNEIDLYDEYRDDIEKEDEEETDELFDALFDEDFEEDVRAVNADILARYGEDFRG